MLVEAYRQYFRPARVRVVLLAESHVHTTAEDRAIPIPPIPVLPGYPRQYAKFVYCLGYGERDLTKHESHPSRDGTPQFWKVFFSCANRVSSLADFGPILGATPYAQRLQNKIELLNELKERGVWLVDTSVVALYNRGAKVPNLNRALVESWRGYTRAVVMSVDPEHVVCIGKAVADAVADDLRASLPVKVTKIAQPNAYLSSAEHMSNFQQYTAACVA